MTNRLARLGVWLLMSVLVASQVAAKNEAASVWERVAAMEKKCQFGTIKVDDKINISNQDVKAHYGEPTEIAHYKLGHPPTTGSIWRYKRPNGDLEFRFFLDTKHVNQIELKAKAK